MNSTTGFQIFTKKFHPMTDSNPCPAQPAFLSVILAFSSWYFHPP